MPAPPAPAVLLGVLAGGRGLRMGGRDKAALLAPGGEPLLSRLLRLGRELGLETVVLGGEGACDVPRLADEPAGVGPIGGLCALLSHARERRAIALACDLPYLSAALLARLAHTESAAAVLAARDPQTGKWQPLFARYDSPRVLPDLRAAIAAGTRSFQTFLRGVEVQELALDEAERAQLRDWDVPGDIQG
jgi:molybdopterin-guanine dinucleotide biosynthesis protein A